MAWETRKCPVLTKELGLTDSPEDRTAISDEVSIEFDRRNPERTRISCNFYDIIEKRCPFSEDHVCIYRK